MGETRGRSEPSRYLEATTPGRGADEHKRPRPGPEYPFYEPSTSHHSRSRHPDTLNNSTIQQPQSTVTASNDGLVGCTSLELVVLASPRSIRCLYCYKDFRCLTKKVEQDSPAEPKMVARAALLVENGPRTTIVALNRG